MGWDYSGFWLVDFGSRIGGEGLGSLKTSLRVCSLAAHAVSGSLKSLQNLKNYNLINPLLGCLKTA
jgi:hypothetical protein